MATYYVLARDGSYIGRASSMGAALTLTYGNGRHYEIEGRTIHRDSREWRAELDQAGGVHARDTATGRYYQWSEDREFR